MKKLIIIIIISGVFSCNYDNSVLVKNIINGNTIELTNGLTVKLLGVQNEESNIKILNHYLKGGIYLYDENNYEIFSNQENFISAIIYNEDGDCVNQILSKLTEPKSSDDSIIVDANDKKPSTFVKYEIENGIMKIPISINDVELYFIFDTGASLITISLTEALFLYKNGKLQNDDFVGKTNFMDANGDISEGVLVNLKSVEIGNRKLENILACVTKSQNAPLLFGQSALEKFGKISIDYNKAIITFE